MKIRKKPKSGKFKKQYVGYADVDEYPKKWDRAPSIRESLGAWIMPCVSMTKKPVTGTRKVRVTIEEL